MRQREKQIGDRSIYDGMPTRKYTYKITGYNSQKKIL